MSRNTAFFCLFAFAMSIGAQVPVATTPKATKSTKSAEATAVQSKASTMDLPVRKVVLYKNGVGYFEHAGAVNGNQKVAIDFTSGQLNDVLQSLTVLDENGGRISGVNYNSTTPLGEQLKTLSLGMSDDPSSVELFQALRGQRVEITGAPGGSITGRLVSIEGRTKQTTSTTGGDDSTPSTSISSTDKFFLTVVSSAGAARVIELTPSLSVRPLDANIQGQLDRYLELLSTARANGLRHLTLDAIGSGQRQLRVSYISEVPVWKATYRIVFPRTANGNATIQGWAVVDNTVGADWNNVQLSLVAGSPQSFIQPLSQPLYTRRPEVAIATGAQLTPQTHEVAEKKVVATNELERRMAYGVAGMVAAPKAITADVAAEPPSPPSEADEEVTVLGRSEVRANSGVYRASNAIQQGDVATESFDDFFKYSLTQPVTIHKNESAMVPILQEDLPTDRVTLWSAKEPSALRALWLENKSNLTLDSGSFSIFEGGEFAGEGLLEPIHPGEKRLLSYAADQAVKIRRSGNDRKQMLTHISMHEGVMVQSSSEVTKTDYTVNNAAEEARVVVIEHARNTNAELDSDAKPAETTANTYRFRVEVAPHQSAELHVNERAKLDQTVRISPDNDYSNFLISVSKAVPELEQQLKPLIDAEVALNGINRKIRESQQKEQSLASDEARFRENLTALEGNKDAGKRFVNELNRTEDQLGAVRKDREGLIKDRDAARTKLNEVISQLSFDTDTKIEAGK